MTSQATPAEGPSLDPVDVAELLKPPRRLSPSGASAFDQCAKKWRRRYIEHLADPPGEAAMVGSFSHRVLELLMQLEKHERSQDTAREIAAAEWPAWESQSDFVALELDVEGVRGFKWKSWKAIANLWNLESPGDVEVRATEQNVQATLAGVPFRGIVDRLDVVDEELVVTDYKSGNAPSKRYQQQRLPQVLLYAAAIAESTNERPARARLLFLGDRRLELSVDVTEDRLGEVTGALADTWAKINDACAADDFPTKTGPLCGWCPYLDICADGQAEVIRRGG